MSFLPSVPHKLKRRLEQRTVFKGLNHRIGAAEGEIYAMENLCSDHDPLLTPRAPRRFLATLKKGRGLFSHESGLYWIDGRRLFKDGEEIGVLEDKEVMRSFCAMKGKILIFPDALSLDIVTLKLTPLAVSRKADVTFLARGLRYQTAAACNSIKAPGLRWQQYFRVGDAVSIGGCQNRPQNNKTAVIREIDGDTLRFDENCFSLLSEYRFTVDSALAAECYTFFDGESDYHFTPRQTLLPGDVLRFFEKRLYLLKDDRETELRAYKGKEGRFLNFSEIPLDTVERGVLFSREVPALSCVFSLNNRLWGIKGSAVYGSKLGDPFNFNVFDHLSDDSYYLESESDGDFTAAAACNGYAVFFKERAVYKLFGDDPANFRLYDVAAEGVKKGSMRSVAPLNDQLFYVAERGVVAFDGSSVKLLSEPLGVNIAGGVAVADGSKYYLSARLDDGSVSLYVFDAERKRWHREDDLHVVTAVRAEVPLALTKEGKICSLAPGLKAGEDEGQVSWWLEFTDSSLNSLLKKNVHKLNLRLDLTAESKVSVEIMFDSSNVWETVKTIRGERKHSVVLPIVPRRCDHFKIRIRGRGPADLYGLACQIEIGSEK